MNSKKVLKNTHKKQGNFRKGLLPKETIFSGSYVIEVQQRQLFK